MRAFNLFAELPSWSLEGEQMAARLVALEDGQRVRPNHFHHGIEEWLLVVAGTPSVLTPEGERALRRGDVVCFPVGPAGAHSVGGPGAVLMVSERRPLDVIEYPESGEIELRPSGRTFRASVASDDDVRGGPVDAVGSARELVNVDDVTVEGDAADPEGYRARSARLGPTLGAERLGATVYELDPGQSVCPYHYECVEEEWVLALTGRAILRDPAGEHELAAGDLVPLPLGPDGGHKVTNRSDDPVRILILSTIPENDLSICVYPDSAKVAVWPWPGRRLRLTETVAYYDGEV